MKMDSLKQNTFLKTKKVLYIIKVYGLNYKNKL
jgi:hypothetical protein